MFGTARKDLDMFRNLCGDEAPRNVVLGTTKWDKVAFNGNNSFEVLIGEKYVGRPFKILMNLVPRRPKGPKTELAGMALRLPSKISKMSWIRGAYQRTHCTR